MGLDSGHLFGDVWVSHFDDEVDLQFENVFQFIQNERGCHVTIDQHMFGSVPHKRYFEFRMLLQQTVEVLAYIEQQVVRHKIKCYAAPHKIKLLRNVTIYLNVQNRRFRS